jgi:hypothetical protein
MYHPMVAVRQDEPAGEHGQNPRFVLDAALIAHGHIFTRRRVLPALAGEDIQSRRGPPGCVHKVEEESRRGTE